MKHGLGLNKILSTIHTYPIWPEANKHARGSGNARMHCNFFSNGWKSIMQSGEIRKIENSDGI